MSAFIFTAANVTYELR